jgi:MFS family permease
MTATRGLSAAHRLLVSRGLRGVIDGSVSVMLAGYLSRLGLLPSQVGVLVTGTLLGSGVLTLAVGLVAHRFAVRRLQLFAALLMVATGLGFATFDRFWPLLIVAVLGTLNPSSGDVSVFLPLEQAQLAHAAAGPRQTAALFARYNVVGTFAGALGALVAGTPELVARLGALDVLIAEKSTFLVYSAVGAVVAWVYAGMPELGATTGAARPLEKSRRAVLQLSALFSLDSFGGGFVVQSLLTLWLQQRFGLSVAGAGVFFFASSLLSALSQLISPKLAARIGFVRTMVYTHIPANLLLMSAAFMPSLPLVLTCLLLRASISSMDVPARQAYVMSVVPPEERAAAASVTNVPRSLASSLSPALAGLLIERSALIERLLPGLGRASAAVPLLCAGFLKIAYDLSLLALFRARDLRPEA